MDEKERAIIKKHSKTAEEIQNEMRTMEAAKKGMTQNVAELEANLREFNDILDPMLDPNTGKPMCWIRRPSQSEWESMIPAELMQYKDITQVPPELAKKYADHQFDMMTKLIAIPAHDAKYWKDHSNILFQELFQMHLTEVYRKLGIMVENF